MLRAGFPQADQGVEAINQSGCLTAPEALVNYPTYGTAVGPSQSLPCRLCCYGKRRRLPPDARMTSAARLQTVHSQCADTAAAPARASLWHGLPPAHSKRQAVAGQENERLVLPWPNSCTCAAHVSGHSDRSSTAAYSTSA